MSRLSKRQAAAWRQQFEFLRAAARPEPPDPISAGHPMFGPLASLGLVTEIEGTVRVTAAGFAWLRRQLATDDPFREQHQEIRRRSLGGSGARPPLVKMNDAESPLAWLRGRKDRAGEPMLSEEQYGAGERLRRDFTFAGMTPRVTASWSLAAGGRSAGAPHSGAIRDEVLAAKDRVNRAIAAVGPELGRILMDVCCLLKGIEATEAELGFPKRAGKIVLQIGLTALARHYGMLSSGRPGTNSRATQHWGTADFKPAI